MKDIIRTLQSQPLKSYLKSHYVDHIWLVGSFSRGEETAESDIDLLFQFQKNPNLDRSIYSLPERLEKKLGKKIDMFDIDYLNKHIASTILADKISIW